MNMQSGAAEQEPCCVLAGTLIKVAQICCKRGQKKNVWLSSANLFGCGGKQRKCVK